MIMFEKLSQWVSCTSRKAAGILIISLSSLAVGTLSNAATIERYVDDMMGCSILLSGQIEEGDAEKLKELSDTVSRESNYGVERICFNSPGGSFIEGIRLAKTIQGNYMQGTAIAKGHICESACALAFMAGGGTEGGFGTVQPVMHPQAKLGFHAPAIEIPDGQYTPDQVQDAWITALQAVGEIASMRSETTVGGTTSSYPFPEELFLQMLTTPFDSMFYIDTVGKASKFGFAIHPAGIFTGDIQQSIVNACKNSTGYYSPEAEETNPIIENSRPNYLEIIIETGFAEEAVNPCELNLSLSDAYYSNMIRSSEKKIITGKASIYRKKPKIYSYMTFDSETPLNQVPVNPTSSWSAFTSKAIKFSKASTEVPQSCRLDNRVSRIVNVSEYSNLRDKPGIGNRIIARVPLGDIVQQKDPGTYLATQRCLDACQSDNQKSINQCIDNNEVWIEVEYNGRRGFLSRKFLAEAP